MTVEGWARGVCFLYSSRLTKLALVSWPNPRYQKGSNLFMKPEEDDHWRWGMSLDCD